MNIGPLQPRSQFAAAQTTPQTPQQLAAHREIVTAVAALNKSKLLGQDNEETIKTRGQLHGQEFRHLWSESREPVAKRVGQAVVQHRAVQEGLAIRTRSHRAKHRASLGSNLKQAVETNVVT
jgi:hypothetical protein